MLSVIARRIRRLFERRRKIELRFNQNFGDGAANSRRVVEILAANDQQFHKRTEADHVFIGRFLSLVLLIEDAIAKVIRKVDDEVNNLMLGRKIDFFKEILKELKRVDPEGDLTLYRNLIQPLVELKCIRDQFAHDISKTAVELSELKQILAYLRKRKPVELEAILQSKWSDERERIAVIIALFAFCVLERLCFLEYELA